MGNQILALIYALSDSSTFTKIRFLMVNQYQLKDLLSKTGFGTAIQLMCKIPPSHQYHQARAIKVKTILEKLFEIKLDWGK